MRRNNFISFYLISKRIRIWIGENESSILVAGYSQQKTNA